MTDADLPRLSDMSAVAIVKSDFLHRLLFFEEITKAAPNAFFSPFTIKTLYFML